MKVKAFKLPYFRGNNHFEDYEYQNYLVFQQVHRYAKTVANITKVTMWKSKGLSGDSTKPPVGSNNSLTPALNHVSTDL